ncbi:hypothetical protein OPQ81_001784 [Rhizoctonia solani]|nr:hypothetical protein OPQ81_001784 [Rhizoctonia solani]
MWGKERLMIGAHLPSTASKQSPPLSPHTEILFTQRPLRSNPTHSGQRDNGITWKLWWSQQRYEVLTNCDENHSYAPDYRLSQTLNLNKSRTHVFSPTLSESAYLTRTVG